MNDIRKHKLKREGYIGFLFILPALIYFTILYFYPAFRTFLISFYKVDPMSGALSKYEGLNFYKTVFNDLLFWRSIKNVSLLIAFSVPITIGLGLFVALLLDRILNLKLRNTLSLLYFLPLAASLVAAALIWDWLLNPVYGLVNSVLAILRIPGQKWLTDPSQVIPSLAIISIWQRIGFDAVIFLAGLQAIPHEYLEAAKIDGASSRSIFLHVTLPLLNPQIVMVSVLELIFGFKIFDQVFVATRGGPANTSLVPVLYLYDKAFTWFNFGEASAVGVFLFIVVLGISIVQRKFLRRTIEY